VTSPNTQLLAAHPPGAHEGVAIQDAVRGDQAALDAVLGQQRRLIQRPLRRRVEKVLAGISNAASSATNVVPSTSLDLSNVFIVLCPQ